MTAFRPLHGLLKLTWLELKIFIREPMGFIASFAMPLIMFVVLSRAFGQGLGERLNETLGEAAQTATLRRGGVPVGVAVFIAINAVLSLVAIISIYREGGILKRLRATPLEPVTILVTHVLVKLILTALTVLLMILAGRRYYPADADVPVIAFTLALLLSTWSILSIGFIIASVVRTARFAQPLGSLVLMGMLPFSGILPFELPSSMQTVSRFVPLTYAVSLLSGIWQGDAWSAHLVDIAALVAVFVVCTLIASRVFRWE